MEVRLQEGYFRDGLVWDNSNVYWSNLQRTRAHRQWCPLARARAVLSVESREGSTYLIKQEEKLEVCL
jgi:hypothetical protein